MAAARFWRDAALPFVESRRADHSRACYRAHSHTTWSIGAVDAGRSVFSVGEQSQTLQPGMLVLVPAGCVHACNPEPATAWSYQMLHLDADWLAQALPRAAGARLQGQAQVLDDVRWYAAFCALNDALFAPGDAARKQAALAAFMRAIGSPKLRALAEPAPSADLPDALARVRALIDADPAARLPLAQLARCAGMTPRQLVPAFRRATGLTPHAYQIDARVRLARALLRQGHAAAEVAHDAGFFDQSHLANSFRARVAATPVAYQRAG